MKRGTNSPLFYYMYMESLENYIWNTAESLLENEALFLVEVKISEGKSSKITVILDGDNGVSIGECSSLSRKLGNVLEEKGEPESAFILEVTSPGIDSPLKHDRQYTKNIGRTVKVKTTEAVVEGILVSVNNDSVELKIEGSKKEDPIVMEIKRSEIVSVVVQISFK